MKKPAYPRRFKSMSIDGLRLKNRITMAEAILSSNKAGLIKFYCDRSGRNTKI
jgi:hypothetical protein